MDGVVIQGSTRTPSNRGRKLRLKKELNNRTTKDAMVKILLIIDNPPRILANVICPQLYMLAYTISGSGAGHRDYIIKLIYVQALFCTNKLYIGFSNHFFEIVFQLDGQYHQYQTHFEEVQEPND